LPAFSNQVSASTGRRRMLECRQPLVPLPDT
jgi:hypothetical protein